MFAGSFGWHVAHHHAVPAAFLAAFSATFEKVFAASLVIFIITPPVIDYSYNHQY